MIHAYGTTVDTVMDSANRAPQQPVKPRVSREGANSMATESLQLELHPPRWEADEPKLEEAAAKTIDSKRKGHTKGKIPDCRGFGKLIDYH